MSLRITRRAAAGGLLAGLATAALGEAPAATPRPLARFVPGPAGSGAGARLVERAKLGGAVGYVVMDAGSGEVVDSLGADAPMPPASTLKSVTSAYALDRLGLSFRFRTRVIAAGEIKGGRLEGDLVLAGDGDPTLDTDRLAELAVALRESGLIEVTGRFLVWPGAVPSGDRIDGDQPEHVGYNPAFGGLNLNFNRVHFEWKRRGGDYDVTMEARGTRFSPATDVARVELVDRTAPIFDYSRSERADVWSVARGALGKEDGARWLPVRAPAEYAGDVFRTLARSNGIVLKRAEVVRDLPAGRVLAESESDPLPSVLRDMLKHSTNLTAEMLGLRSSLADGLPVDGLPASGARMAGWAASRIGPQALRFRDHSGLGYGSEISARNMAALLAAAPPELAQLMKPMPVPDPSSDKGVLASAQLVAKTGTLNFVSSLTGYLTTPSGRRLVFAIFTADTARRDAIPPEARENPPGARGWANRSRGLQKSLLGTWATVYDRA